MEVTDSLKNESQLLKPRPRSANGRLKKNSDIKGDLKKGVLIYFLLLIFEGALRKWFLPFLSTPLLLVRDPVAVWILVTAYNHGYFKPNTYFKALYIIGSLRIITAVIWGHGNIIVALYGARTYLIHFPLIFVIGSVYDREYVVKIGKLMLWFAIPMALLTYLQFSSPQTAWVNKGVGGEAGGSAFTGALGYSRPPGTFSFTNGNGFFFSLVAVYVCYFWLNPKRVKKYLLIGATLALFIAVPLSISRSLFFQVAVTFLFTFLAVARNRKYLSKLIPAIIGCGLVLLVLSQTTAFQNATGALTTRLDKANTNEGGVQGVFVDRFLGGLATALSKAGQQPFFGYGLGMGTNVGGQLLGGTRKFLLPEGEWGKIVGEMGPVFGLIIIFMRVVLTCQMFLAGYRQLGRGNVLPWLIFSFGIFLISQGQLAQPTNLGFFALVGGLMLASLKVPFESKTKDNKVTKM